MTKLKFLQPKGSVPAGYIGEYDDELAKDLIAKKIAVLYTEEDKKPSAKPVKGAANV